MNEVMKRRLSDSLKQIEAKPIHSKIKDVLELKPSLLAIERAYIAALLIKYKGNKALVAEILAIDVRRLYSKIRKYRLEIFKGRIEHKFDELFGLDDQLTNQS